MGDCIKDKSCVDDASKEILSTRAEVSAMNHLRSSYDTVRTEAWMLFCLDAIGLENVFWYHRGCRG